MASVRLLFPPLFVLLIVIGLTGLACSEEIHWSVFLDNATRTETDALREQYSLMNQRLLANTAVKIIAASEKRADEKFEEEYSKLSEELDRLHKEYLAKIDTLENEQEALRFEMTIQDKRKEHQHHPHPVTLWRYVESEYPALSNWLYNARVLVANAARNLVIEGRIAFNHIMDQPFFLFWACFLFLILPLIWILRRAPMELEELAERAAVPVPFDLTQSPRIHVPEPAINETPPNSPIHLNTKPVELSSSSSPSDSGISKGRLRHLRTLRFDPHATSDESEPVLSMSTSPQESKSDTSLVTQQVPKKAVEPEPSPEEIKLQKEREERGNKAFESWGESLHNQQMRDLEIARALLANPLSKPSPVIPLTPVPSVPVPSATPSVPPTNAALTFSSPIHSIELPPAEPAKPDYGPTVSLTPRNPVIVDNAEEDPESLPQPEVVSDDEVLQDEPKLSRSQVLPKPQIPGPTPAANFPSNQFPFTAPRFHLEQYQAPPMKLSQTLRTESEPLLKNSGLTVTPARNPAISPETLADSRSLRKNSQKLRNPYAEPDEPEPQPVSSASTSPLVARSRSTSVESESQQATSRAREQRNVPTSPTHSREAYYRRDLSSSHDTDSASKPRREIDYSDTFDQSEAESQPGSDSDREAELE